MGWLYESKGCTLFPDGNYGSCCQEHDLAYSKRLVSRSEADLKLYECIRERGRPKTAIIVYIAVRVFGWIWWGRYYLLHKYNKS